MFQTWLAVIALILIGVFSNVFGGKTAVAPTELKVVETATEENATSTASFPVAPIKDTSTKKIATTSPAKKVAQSTAPEATTTHPGTVAVVPTPPPTQQELDTAVEKVRGAIVNILCETSGSTLHSISGSGAFIDSRGIIITAAHVSQLFLLKDYPRKNDIRCIIRTGSPARDMYTATPIYISESWVRANADSLGKKDPTGTGENDFAFLAVTGSASIPLSALPSSFPAVPIATKRSDVGSPVIIGTYGAQFISSQQIISGLYPTLVFGNVKDVYTFRNNSVDLISLGGTVAAQSGSSGGIVANAKGEVVGVVTTSTLTGDTNTRDLRAITPFHIRTSFNKDTGENLDSLFTNNDLPTLIQTFRARMQALTDLLVEKLQLQKN